MGRQRTKPAPTPPTTTRGRRTRDGLILAGREILEQRGWSAFTPEAVAQTAGVSYGTFYTYFESRDDLLHHVVRSVAGEMLAASLVSPDGVDDPYARLVESNRLYLRAWDRASKVLRLVDQGAAADEALRQIVHEIRDFYVGRATKGLRRLQDAGLANPDLDPRLTALALGSMVEQVAHARSAMEEPYDEDTVVDHLSRLWASAIGLQGAPDEGWAARARATAGTASD
ncbi:TetR/AcrR family transcriptional regulator [Streptomyces adustus]|uniref:TetR/AcrR family transcriptional regulator n=1 Tax=Streptomyces adustus TaxID=1609272 RepID=A0A5N8VBL5_9ACTN|nr:TetR/AcrR family transcriptional regulator [Streptomyces adustus]MPY32631.1 TetR/AcrR family transcriptional regulator [Streptomyces adustus]